MNTTKTLLGACLALLMTGCVNSVPQTPQSNMQESSLQSSYIVDDVARVGLAELIKEVQSLKEELHTYKQNSSNVSSLSQNKVVVAPIVHQANTETPIQPISAKKMSIKYIVKEAVNVRSCPEKKCEVKDVLSKGHKFNGFDNGNGWVEIESSELFVNSKFVKKYN